MKQFFIFILALLATFGSGLHADVNLRNNIDPFSNTVYLDQDSAFQYANYRARPNQKMRPFETITRNTPQPSTIANLTNSIKLSKGYGDFTTPTVSDTDGNRLRWDTVNSRWEAVKAEEVRFDTRRVENLAPHSEDLTSALWTIADTAANSVETATTIELTGTDNSYHYKRVDPPNGDTTGKSYIATAKVQWISGETTVSVRFSPTPSGTAQQANIDLSDGEEKEVSFAITASADINLLFGIDNRSAIGASNTGATKVTFTNIKIEESTGRTDTTTPSEYVSSSVLSSPYHGANVDGVQYFTYENPNSVTDNVVTDTGTRTLISNVKGMLVEGAATNLISQPRDLSTTWTALNTGTSALNVTGIDGQPNSASTVTDNAAGSVDGRRFTVTIPDDSNTNIARIKIKKDAITSRFPLFYVSYTGGTQLDQAVFINTQTGVLTDATFASLDDGAFGVIEEGGWWHVYMTLTNNGTGNTTATIDIYPAYSDVVNTANAATIGTVIIDDVALVLNSNSPTSSLLNTGGHARLSDEDGTNQDENINDANFSLEVTVSPSAASTSLSGTTDVLKLGSNDFLSYNATSTRWEVTDGTNTATVTDTFTAGQSVTLKITGSLRGLQISADGTAGTVATYDLGLPSGDLTFKGDYYFKELKTYRIDRGESWVQTSSIFNLEQFKHYAANDEYFDRNATAIIRRERIKVAA